MTSHKIHDASDMARPGGATVGSIAHPLSKETYLLALTLTPDPLRATKGADACDAVGPLFFAVAVAVAGAALEAPAIVRDGEGAEDDVTLRTAVDAPNPPTPPPAPPAPTVPNRAADLRVDCPPTIPPAAKSADGSDAASERGTMGGRGAVATEVGVCVCA